MGRHRKVQGMVPAQAPNYRPMNEVISSREKRFIGVLVTLLSLIGIVVIYFCLPVV